VSARAGRGRCAHIHLCCYVLDARQQTSGGLEFAAPFLCVSSDGIAQVDPCAFQDFGLMFYDSSFPSKNALPPLTARLCVWFQALQLVREAKEAGVELSEVFYGALLQGYADAEDYSGVPHGIACGLLQLKILKIQHTTLGATAVWTHLNTTAGLEPDSVCYTSMIHACSKAGKAEKALMLLRQMQSNGLMPTEVCCLFVIAPPSSNPGGSCGALFVAFCAFPKAFLHHFRINFES
jgi:pentatricopeptide repeat protein